MMTSQHIQKILHEHWGIECTELQTMEGYESTNYRILTAHDSYVLKVYPIDRETLQILHAENQVLIHLSDSDLYPNVLSNDQQQYIIIDEEHECCYRLLSFLEGTFWAETEVTEDLLRSFGERLADTDRRLESIAPLAMKAKKIVWDLDQFLTNERYISAIPAAADRHLVEYFFLQYREKVLPQLPYLRKSLIHNDANDWNVLTQGRSVTGLIDFGDMVYSSTINELAVGLTYVLMGREDPIADAQIVIAAYHEIYPLRAEELDLLYYLIAARLCTSVCNSAYTKLKKPDSEYITISEKGAWQLLRKLLTINPIHASHSFREACGMPQPSNTSIDELLILRKQNMSEAMSLSYSEPIHMKSAAFQYMYDAEGNAILDAYNNIKHVGHCHPHVVHAGQRAMARLNTNTRYVYDELTAYTEHLLRYFPSSLSKVFLVNSGSAASDLAIRLATTHTGRQHIGVVQHGYHGNSIQGIHISHYKYAHQGGQGKAEYVIESPMPDTYRGSYRGSDAGQRYAEDFIHAAEDYDLAAFIAEPIVGCGGQVPLAEGYLQAIYPYVRERGGVCISDEVQTGFGRMGATFWGYELHGVIPDIVVLGKPIGNGHPMGAVVCTAEIAESFANGMEFFSSFGGNPVSCAIGKAVLEVIESEQLQQHALEVGSYIMEGYRSLRDRYPSIGDVRGSGLFIGIDMISDTETRQADRQIAAYLKNGLRQRNILISTDGPDDNVIKIKAPLCFSKENANTLLHHSEELLRAYPRSS